MFSVTVLQVARAGKRQGDAHGDTDPQLQLLNGLEDAFPEAVEAVSYDYLQLSRLKEEILTFCMLYPRAGTKIRFSMSRSGKR